MKHHVWVIFLKVAHFLLFSEIHLNVQPLTNYLGVGSDGTSKKKSAIWFNEIES